MCPDKNQCISAKLLKLKGFKIQHKIGSGSFSTVYKALTDNEQHTEVAIKCIDKTKVSENRFDSIVNEIKALKLLHHQHIVTMLDFLWDESRHPLNNTKTTVSKTALPTAMRNTSTPTTSAQPDLNSSSSSSNFEFSSPITKPPPITLNDFITLSQLKGPDIPNQTYSPPPPASTHVAEVHVVRSPSSDLPGFPGTTQPDSASLVKRINELINQRESLIDKISELSSKLSQYEVNVHANVPLSSSRSRKIAIFSDSMLRGVAQLMHQHINTISSNTKITSMIKPNAYFSQVTEGVESQCRDFGADDFVIIQAGTNDMNTLEPNSAKILPIKHLISLANITNVILCSIPYRFDSLAHLSTNVYETNTYLKYVCTKYNFTYFDTNAILRRSHFTRHGLHYNGKGKYVLSKNILDLIAHRSSVVKTPQIISRSNQKTNDHEPILPRRLVSNSNCTKGVHNNVSISQTNNQEKSETSVHPVASDQLQKFSKKPNYTFGDIIDISSVNDNLVDNLSNSTFSFENFPPLLQPRKILL
ncbi:hypothetical protein M8J77_020513 [Diaphorina citri]|nr:hypothetical protein M8J77_020513 [Diaphorina citri]